MQTNVRGETGSVMNHVAILRMPGCGRRSAPSARRRPIRQRAERATVWNVQWDRQRDGPRA
eukprot:2120027-Pleurochrysis_carterae.AAC.2